MLKLHKNYRSTYTGEDVVTERKLDGGVWHTQAEMVPNRVVNNQISNLAVVIGNGTNRSTFNLQHLKKPQGLLGANTVQTYGCNALYRDFDPDFLIAVGDKITAEIAASGYAADHIVYAGAIHLLEFPNTFYLIPHNPHADAGSIAMYMACFDGHKRVYMLGFDGQVPGENNNIYVGTNCYDSIDTHIEHDKWIAHQKQVMDVYDDVEFVWVTPWGRNPIPEDLRYCLNLRQISYRQMVLECDL